MKPNLEHLTTSLLTVGLLYTKVTILQKSTHTDGSEKQCYSLKVLYEKALAYLISLSSCFTYIESVIYNIITLVKKILQD